MCVGFLIGILVRVSLEVKPSLTKPKCQNNVLLKWKLDYGLLGGLNWDSLLSTLYHHYKLSNPTLNIPFRGLGRDF